MIRVTDSQKRALGIATAFALLAGFFFLKPYLMLILFAVVVAMVFNPIYQRLLREKLKPGLAATITLLASFVIVIVPVTLVIAVSVQQASQALALVRGSNVNDMAKQFIEQFNQLMASLHIPYTLTATAVKDGLSSSVNSIGQGLVRTLQSSLSGVFRVLTETIIYIFVFMSLLTQQDALLRTIKKLNPLGEEARELYFERIGAMTKAMVRGQFVIAIIQGFIDAGLLYLAGFHSTFFFFFLLLTMLSIIPLGGGIIVIPVGIGLMLTGNIAMGLVLILGHILIVTSVDNVLRPYLVPRESKLDPALTLLSVFAGLRFFGFVGIVLGPVLMITIVTTVQVYLEVFKNDDEIDQPSSKPRRGLGRLQFWKK